MSKSNNKLIQIWRERSITRRLLSFSFAMLVIAGLVISALLTHNVRKEMLELIDANLIQYANSLYMLEQRVQGYGLVSDPIKIDDDERREHEAAKKSRDKDAREKDEREKDEREKDERRHERNGTTQNKPTVNLSDKTDIPITVPPPKDKLVSSVYSEFSMAFQVWDVDKGKLIIRSRNAPETVMAPLSAGFVDQKLGDASWRTYVYLDRANQRAIVVAQEQFISNHIINEVVTRLTMPIVVVFALLLVAFILIIRQSLRPLNTLKQAITERSSLNLQPIELNSSPAEITPVVGSLNTLMKSLEDSLNKERHFTGNAAHELRTPLAVIDTLAQTAMKTQDMSILPKIKAATDSARRQIEQLLTLARLDANAGLTQLEEVNLSEVCQTVCADLLNIHDKKMDIQLHGDECALIHSNSEITYILLKNIIENAFKHTSNDGTAQIRIEVKALPSPTVWVVDNGTGIAPEQLTRITERFYRAEQAHEGFGIGLSIVQRICQLHRAKLDISARNDGVSGLRVKITYPV